MQAVFPGAILQFEDFNNACAFRLLGRYRDRLCCFNDDVQGTGAMGLAGLVAAARITGRALTEQRIVFFGAGEACLGIGALVTRAMQREGLAESEAKGRCRFIDSRGVVSVRRPDLAEHKRPFAHDCDPSADLVTCIERFAPTVLIGASGQGGAFTRPALEAMARTTGRPVVFALSNPTSRAECTAEQAYGWTGGRVVFASGSPFPPVEAGGHTHSPGQANNSFVFPGVGLGLLVSGASRVTDEMFFAASEALAAQVTTADLDAGRVFPAAARMREVAAAVAVAVAEVAYRQGRATAPPAEDLRSVVAKRCTTRAMPERPPAAATDGNAETAHSGGRSPGQTMNTAGDTANERIAARLREAAEILQAQAANPFRVGAYRRAAEIVAQLPRSVAEIHASDGVAGLDALPGIGAGLAAAIAEMLHTGRWALLDRLRGSLDPVSLFRTVPGIGPELARRIHDVLGVDTLEALEAACHDHRLASVPGVGERRAAGIRAALAELLDRSRLRSRVTHREASAEPPVQMLLDVDQEYRDRAGAGQLPTIAPRRFNPEGAAWLSVLHTTRGPWHFTALFSNTARAHELGRTHDWVVLYFYDDQHVERQRTVVTETRGALAGKRVVRGREDECRAVDSA